MQTSVLIIDNNPIIRFGLREMLEMENDIRVCADLENYHSAFEAIENHHPDMIIMDIDMGATSGIDFIKQIKSSYKEIRILVFTFLDESIYAERVLQAQASGFISKTASCEKIRWGVRSVKNGGLCISEEIEKKLVEEIFFHKKSESPIDNLSNRELQILDLISKGLKPSQMADCLNLSAKTVENYRSNLRYKLNLKNASELFQYAIHWRMDQQSVKICA
ncbi:MAG: response regulator transcription factor [Candidatus Omnitrophica bacterium]|nr:response regulator transcription factor [Candidatus Omnitrophota bacterium]